MGAGWGMEEGGLTDDWLPVRRGREGAGGCRIAAKGGRRGRKGGRGQPWGIHVVAVVLAEHVPPPSEGTCNNNPDPSP